MTDLTDFIIKDREAYQTHNGPGATAARNFEQEDLEVQKAETEKKAREAYNMTNLGGSGPPEGHYDYVKDYEGGNTFKPDDEGGVTLHNSAFVPGATTVAGVDVATGTKFSSKWKDKDGEIAKGRDMLSQGQFNTLTGATYDQTDGLFHVANGVLKDKGTYQDFVDEVKGPWNNDQLDMAWYSADFARRTMEDIDTRGKRYYDQVREEYDQYQGVLNTIPAEGYTEETLAVDKNWIENSRKLGDYIFGPGKNANATDEEIAESSKFLISQLRNNFDMTMLWANKIVDEQNPEAARAWLALDAQYEAMDIGSRSFGRAAAAQINITNLLTFGGGVLISQLGKFAMTEGVKASLKAVAYGTAFDAALSGAAGVAENVGRQNIEIVGEQRDEVDPVEAGVAGTVTAAMGAGIGLPINVAANKTVRDYAAKKTGDAVKFMGDNISMGPMSGSPAAQRGSIGIPVTGQQKVEATFKLQDLMSGLKDGSKPVTAQQAVKAAVNKGEITPQEVKWSGIEEYLEKAAEEGRTINRADLAKYIEDKTPIPELVETAEKTYGQYSFHPDEHMSWNDFEETSYIVSEPLVVNTMVKHFDEKGYKFTHTNLQGETIEFTNEEAFKLLDFEYGPGVDEAGAFTITGPEGTVAHFGSGPRSSQGGVGIEGIHDWMWSEFETVGTTRESASGYRERMLVIRGGDKEGQYSPPHFQNSAYELDHTDAMIGHSRVEKAESPELGTGKMVLEIQSDFHKAGQKRGYIDEDGNWVGTQEISRTEPGVGQGEHLTYDADLYRVLLDVANKNGIDPSEKNAVARVWPFLDEPTRKFMAKGRTPLAPYGKDWDAMGMRLEIMESINNGDEFIAWPSTADQIDMIEQWGGMFKGGESIVKRATTERVKAMKKMGFEVEQVDLGPTYMNPDNNVMSLDDYGSYEEAADAFLARSNQAVVPDPEGDGYILYAYPNGMPGPEDSWARVHGGDKLKRISEDEIDDFVAEIVDEMHEEASDRPAMSTVFNIIRLTDEVKQKFVKEGMPMYSVAPIGLAAAAEAKKSQGPERDENGRFKKKTAGLVQDVKNAYKKKKFERRVNKMFDTPQGGYNRRKEDQKPPPIQTIEPPDA